MVGQQVLQVKPLSFSVYMTDEAKEGRDAF